MSGRVEAAQQVARNVFIKAEYEDLIIALYNKLKAKAAELLKHGLDFSNILLLTDMIMKEVGKLKHLVGFEKKAVVITLIRKFVDDAMQKTKEGLVATGMAIEEATRYVEEKFKQLCTMIDTALDSFIDQLYSLAPKAYGKVKKFCCPCLA